MIRTVYTFFSFSIVPLSKWEKFLNSLKTSITKKSIGSWELVVSRNSYIVFFTIKNAPLFRNSETLLHIQQYSASVSSKTISKPLNVHCDEPQNERQKKTTTTIFIHSILWCMPFSIHWSKEEKKRNQLETLVETIFASTYCAHVTSMANSSLFQH